MELSCPENVLISVVYKFDNKVVSTPKLIDGKLVWIHICLTRNEVSYYSLLFPRAICLRSHYEDFPNIDDLQIQMQMSQKT